MRQTLGQVFWKGQRVAIKTPHQAHDLGINIVHQELMLVPTIEHRRKHIYRAGIQ